MHSVAEELKTNTTYNGWSNRETWVVNLWLTNDECYYQELSSILHNFETVSEQVEELEQYVHWIVDADKVGVASDLLSTSLGRVGWYEIVSNNQE